MRGKNVNLFLMDGDATGRIKCSISNWTGVAYKIPRTELEKCKNRDELKWSGIYFLFGEDEETGDSLVYVGQAGSRKNGEGVLQRLFEHTKNPKKDYWSEAVVLTTSNNSFGPTEISFLEKSFCELAQNAKRYRVQNENSPNGGNITEEKKSEMEEFIEQASLLISTLGYRVFDAILAKTVEEGGDGLELFLNRTTKKSDKQLKAKCVRTKDGFTVMKGSVIETIDSPGLDRLIAVKKARKEAKIDENGILQENVTFSSPSYAGIFVIGNSVNGQTEWKTKDGKTLKDYDTERLGIVDSI